MAGVAKDIPRIPRALCEESVQSISSLERCRALDTFRDVFENPVALMALLPALVDIFEPLLSMNSKISNKNRKLIRDSAELVQLRTEAFDCVTFLYLFRGIWLYLFRTYLTVPLPTFSLSIKLDIFKGRLLPPQTQ